MLKSPLLRLSTLALLISAGQASAYELYASDDSHLNATLEAVFGVFHSQENYALSGRLDEGSSSWREGYIKYGLSFDQGLAGVGTAIGWRLVSDRFAPEAAPVPVSAPHGLAGLR